ncbi:MAG: succinate dehydrogenase assembly factor 2 [Robiginitomaculum sp.]|nr:succinate dehydrogenase assembly factor 2 [Robiginitomaculum sp.]
MEQRKKRLKLRAWRRGTRELDLIFGTVVDRLLTDLDEQSVAQIEALLDENDLEVYDWLIGKTPVPEKHKNKMMEELQNFAMLSAKLQLGRIG